MDISLDLDAIEACRRSSAKISADVYNAISGRSSVGIERAIFRLLGLNGADAMGRPYANLIVDMMRQQGWLSGGAWQLAARIALASGSFDHETVQRVLQDPRGLPDCEARMAEDWAARMAAGISQQMNSIRATRQKMMDVLPLRPAPWRYVIVATGDIRIDAIQARLAAEQGADIIAIIRSTAQSLLDYVPEGLTSEGFGGTFATKENFRYMRAALDEVSRSLGRYVHLTNYASGLCMAEMAALGAQERLDMMLSDAMYGVLFRDINIQRNFIDQHAARTIQGWAGIIINTGEDNYLTTADAVEAAHTVLASQFLNHAFARKAGLTDDLIGLGHAFEMDPAKEDGLLLEMADALLSRACFPGLPLKYMPPTRYKDGDIFQGQVLDAMFSLTSVATGQVIHLTGMATEAVHSPHLQDRYSALKSLDYVHRYARSFAEEFQVRPGGIIAGRAASVLAQARTLLEAMEKDGLFDAVSRGVFGGVRRGREGGKGLDGVFELSAGYLDPLGLLPQVSSAC